MAWFNMVSLTAVFLASFVLSGLLYSLYLLALPKPLPEIPYNKASAKCLLGDVPLMRSAPYRRQWTWSQPSVHNSPIAQVFLLPFRRPHVVVSDYRDVIDICSRRTNEFDRGTRTREVVGITAPKFHFGMETRDKDFKFHKELVRDLMTPSFLKEVSAPRIYDNTTNLLKLWTIKAQKARGHPFEASRDLYLTSLDVICSVAFGFSQSSLSLRQQITHTLPQTPQISQANISIPVSFTNATLDPELDSLLDIPEMVSIAQGSAFPWVAQRLALLKLRHAKAWWYRKRLVRRQTDMGLQRVERKGVEGRECALDQLLWREMGAARKGGRKPDFFSPAIRDETLGFLLGGHDSSATVLSWWVKYMSMYPLIQTHLRDTLRHAHPEASSNVRLPTLEEILSSSIPYLDAVIEETLRFASVATLIVRVSTCNTQIRGYPIPKGTNIIMPLTGPSLTLPALSTSHPLSEKTSSLPPWDDSDIHLFRPERWLKYDQEAKEEVFDAKAGPNLAFSAGPRACFGKRLALMQLRISVTLLIWRFEFGVVEGVQAWMEIQEKLFNLPRNCFVQLREI